MGLINYLGNSKVIKRICQLLKVTDVQDGEGHSLVDENGIAIVSGGGGGSSTLAGLTDVDVTGASDGDVLSFDGTNWKDKTLATVAASGAYNDLLNKPTTLSAFTNDTGFITNSVNNLTNYYLKSETYTKSEVNTLIGQISTISILVVQALPQTGETNIIYLVPKSASETSNAYDEYIYVSGAWELIGDTTVDLSNYYTKSEVDALIPDELADLTDDSTHRLVTDTEKTAWSNKSVVSANPQSTTRTLSGLEIDGVGYDIPSGGGNVQPDWNETDSTADDYIKNKPTIPAAVAVKGNEEQNYRTGNVNLTPENLGALRIKTGGGIAEVSGSGQYSYCKIATITINRTYINHPVVFELSGRGLYFVRLTVIFASADSVDPNLSVFSVDSSDFARYFIKKTATSTWEIYGQYTGVWGHMCLHRITGTGYANVGVTVNMVNVSSLPSGCKTASEGIGLAAEYAVKAGTAFNANTVNNKSVEANVPANAVFTDTNNAVAQTNTTGNADYRVLFSVTADDTNRTEGARKGLLYWNPSSRRLFFGNGYGFYGNASKAITFQDGSDSNHALCHAAYGGDSNVWGLYPNRDGRLGLGNAYRRWGQIYSTSGSINTSDRNEKKDIVALGEKAKDLILNLNPVSFKFIDGKSGRTHYGLIAQDVEETLNKLGMTSMDFAGLCKDVKMEENYKTVIDEETGSELIVPDYKEIPNEYRYGLRYEEFIPAMIKTIQIQQEEIEMLKERLTALESNLT